MELISYQQLVFIEHLLHRRSFGWQEPHILIADTLAPYGKKELATLTHPEFVEILGSSLFWDFCNLESYEEEYEEEGQL